MYPETILPITAHIPHPGTGIPDAVRDQFIPWPGELWREIAMVTDWYTDELFGLPGIAATQTPIKLAGFDAVRNDIWAVMLCLAQEAASRLEGLSRRNPGTGRRCGGDERWRLCHVC
jgi:N-formylglutamate amidohydrolase